MLPDYGFSVGDHARHRSNPMYGWAKILAIIPGKTGVNTHGYKIAKVEWTVGKSDNLGLIKYFALRDLVKE